MKRLHIVIVVFLIALFTGVGWYFGHQNLLSGMADKPSDGTAIDVAITDKNGVVQDDSGKTVKYWYDPMVPGQKFDKPGKSPFMDMMLEPKYANEADDGEEGGVVISPQTAQNLGIRLEKVKMANFGDSLSAVGRIEVDERRFYAVQTRVPGFVEKLSVRALGDPVRKGQKIAEIYSPEILAAQQEYLTLISLNQVDADGSLKQAARNRLKLLGMSEGEIRAITKSGKPSQRFGVYAPASGVLTELGVREGAQLMSGSSLMQITDLSQVWLVAEVPESDANRLKPGLDAEVHLQSFAGEVFKGKVTYLYPTLNGVSRTLQVRVELPNQANRLRPGMYGNVVFTGQTYAALSVPSESIIATGKRKIVIVKEANGYRPVEITSGQERDNLTEVLSGLSEGEQVVASGQFLMDSEASLSGVLTRLSKQDMTMDEEIEAESSISKELKPEEAMSKESISVVKMPKGRGKVVEVNAKTGKLVLNHEPIEALGWPSMTMGFKVKDNKQLSQLKVGDEVEFDLKADAQEQYIIEHIEKSAVKTDSENEVKP
ncbi:MAG: efflux RND transporter periplasmic adaptor subunit [Methylophilus sp.]